MHQETTPCGRQKHVVPNRPTRGFSLLQRWGWYMPSAEIKPGECPIVCAILHHVCLLCCALTYTKCREMWMMWICCYYLNMLLMRPICAFGWIPQEIEAETEICVQQVCWGILPVSGWGKQDRGPLALVGSSGRGGGLIQVVPYWGKRTDSLYSLLSVPSLAYQGEGS